MVVAMPGDRCGKAHTRDPAFAEGASYRARQVAFVDGSNSLVRVCQRLFEVVENVGFGGHRGWTRFITNVHRRLLLENCGAEFIVHSGHVLDLLSKGADVLELAIRWSESVFIFRHGF